MKKNNESLEFGETESDPDRFRVFNKLPEIRQHRLTDISQIDPREGVHFCEKIGDQQVVKFCNPEFLTDEKVRLTCQIAFISDSNGFAQIVPELEGSEAIITQEEIATGDFFFVRYEAAFFNLLGLISQRT